MKKYWLSMMAWIIFSIPCQFVANVLPGYEDYKQIKPYEVLEEAGTLILSNSPETVKENGILYQDQFVGKGRLVFHHVNATYKENQKLIICVTNLSPKSQLFIVDREGHTPPHNHYIEAGNQLIRAYFKCTTSKVFVMKPYESILIYDSAHLNWKPQMVLSGMMDVYANDRVQVTFAFMEKEKSVEAINVLKPLERDLAPRGTFKCLTKYQYIELKGKQDIYYLIEDEVDDWLRGRDGLTGKEAINYGNYGVLYKIKLIAEEDATIFICPRGGVFQGTVYWEDGQKYLIARKHAFKTKKERIKIGKIKKGELKTLNYILPNGSAAPVLIGFDMNK